VIRNPHPVTPESVNLLSFSYSAVGTVNDAIGIQTFTNTSGVGYVPGIALVESTWGDGVSRSSRVKDNGWRVSGKTKPPLVYRHIAPTSTHSPTSKIPSYFALDFNDLTMPSVAPDPHHLMRMDVTGTRHNA
jgi:hypothetical protein